MIIGLTSFTGAGKTTVTDYLVSKDFEYYSLSDILRQKLKSRQKEVTRENLQAVGNELRREHGNSVLADKTLERIEQDTGKDAGGGKDFAVDSIRNPAEIEALRKNKDFTLVFIDAPIKLRFERTKARKREKDPTTFKDFKKSEEKELQSKDSSNQQLLRCREMADFVIHNDSTLETLYKKIDELLEGLR